ncbi:MAG: hypothetical protein GXP39_01200 [Chloroflexi bacterium]|nr:hypothetical protein [Chloroflexota bacterium]
MGSVRRLRWPVIAGVLGALGLAALYLGIVTLAESWEHARDLFREDAPFVVPIILGFGIQVGLFTYLKLGLHLPDGTRAAGALTGTAGGTSTLAMVACCAHHVTDVLPLVGLSAAAVFLAEYKIWFMAAGLATNLIGILVMLRLLRRDRRRALTIWQLQEGGCR